jgi:hypothetical protein
MNDTDYTQPAAPFNYYIKTTAVMEHSRGIAWVADLYCGTVKIGTVEQAGDGGADRVYFDQPAHRTVWDLAVRNAFGADEEQATYYLLCAELDATNA